MLSHVQHDGLYRTIVWKLRPLGKQCFIFRCSVFKSFYFQPKPGSLLIWFFALLRFGFLFVFLFCNLPPRDEDAANRKLPIVFNDDSYFILFIALLGLTNGYLANLASIYLPYSVDEQDRERAGASNTFYCAIGVLLGALISLIVVKYATV